MTSPEHEPLAPQSRPVPTPSERRLLRLRAALFLVPLSVYFALRSTLHSDTAALAIGSAIPIACALGLLVYRRKADPFILGTALVFAVACVVSLLLGGGTLPLKLHQAAVTFTIGLVLLVAAAARHPIQLGKRLPLTFLTRRHDYALGVAVGTFLVLHALVHLVLALELSTSAFLAVSRAFDFASIGLGVAAIGYYLRREYAASQTSDAKTRLHESS